MALQELVHDAVASGNFVKLVSVVIPENSYSWKVEILVHSVSTSSVKTTAQLRDYLIAHENNPAVLVVHATTRNAQGLRVRRCFRRNLAGNLQVA